MELLIARIFDGLATGATYSIVAMALVLVFKSTGVINFAQGEFSLVGAYVAYVLSVEQGWPLVLAVIGAVVVVALLASATEKFLIRPFDPANHLTIVTITLGLLLFLGAMVGIIWGYDPRRFPSIFPEGNAITYGVARLRWYTVGVVGSVVVALVALNLLLNRTKTGLAFRAVSSNPESSRLAGIRVGRTLNLGWVLAGAVGTLGAVLYVADPIRPLDPGVMVRVLIFSAAAAVLGGLTSLWGSFVGGLVIGLIQSLAVGYISWIPNEFSLATAIVVLLAVLLVRPTGVFGQRIVERV